MTTLPLQQGSGSGIVSISIYGGELLNAITVFEWKRHSNVSVFMDKGFFSGIAVVVV